MKAPRITSLTNERIKAAVRLRTRREREITGLTIVDGARELRRALDSGIAVETVYVDVASAISDDAQQVVAELGGLASERVVEVSPEVLAKIAFGDRNDGVVGLVRPPAIGLDDLSLGAHPLLVVMEGVEKPGNLGAILRSADGAAVDAVLVADPATDAFNPNVIRASIGAVFAVPIAIAEPESVIAWLSARGVRMITARIDGVVSHTDADLTGAVAIVVGSEADGLSSTWSGPSATAVRIPMLGRGDSLNVSVATGILLFEARRQRDAQATSGTTGPT